MTSTSARELADRLRAFNDEVIHFVQNKAFRENGFFGFPKCSNLSTIPNYFR